MGHSLWQGQLRAAPTLDLVTTPTAAIGWTTAAGMAAPGVTAAMVVAVVTVGVATPTTTTEETVEAEEVHLVEAVAREPVRFSDEVAGTVAAALGEAAVVDETARGVVPLVTVPLSARPRFQARTAVRSLW